MPQRRPDGGGERRAQEQTSSLSDADFAKDELEVSGREAAGPPPVPDAVLAEATRTSPMGPPPRSPEVHEDGGAPRSSRGSRGSRSPRSPRGSASPQRRAWEMPAPDDTIGGTRSLNARVRSLEEMDEAVQFLKRKFKSRSYSHGGEDPSTLFKHFDRDNSGGLSLQEFCRAARTIGHIRPSQMSDEELRNLFVHIDTNKPQALLDAESSLRDAKGQLAAVKDHDVQTAEKLSEELARKKQHYREIYEHWESEQAKSVIDISELTAFVWGDEWSRRNDTAKVEQQRVRPPTKVVNPEAIEKLRKKFQSVSYSYLKGQDAAKLFRRFDRNNSGGLTLDAFLQASRKVGLWEMSDGELKRVFHDIENGETDDDGEPTISIQQLTTFVWPAEDESPSSKVSPEKKTPGKSRTRDTPRINDEQAKSFYEKQTGKKERTERRLKEQEEQEFKAAHTFKPDVKKLNRNTLTPRGAASVVLADAHEESAQMPLYKDGHNHRSKVFDRLYTVSPSVERHERLKQNQEHMTAAEAIYHDNQRGLVRHGGKHAAAFKPIRHNPGGHQPGFKNKQAKIEETRISTLKKKLRALSYTVDGQNPQELFRRLDSDHNGVLSLDEFKMALIKGAHAHDMSEDEQEYVFKLLDTDRDGSISTEELTTFVWGAEKTSSKSTGTDSPHEQLLPSPAKPVSPTPPSVYGLTRDNPEAAGLVPHARHQDQDETPPTAERSMRSLKRELRTRGMDSTGTKIELTKRLAEQEKRNVDKQRVDPLQPKLAPGSMRSAVRSLMQGYMQGEVSAQQLASPAHKARRRQEGLQTMLLELDIACVNVESKSSSTASVRVVLKSLFEYAEAAFARGEREHVEMLLPKLEAVADMLTRVENEQSTSDAVEEPEIDHDSDLVQKAKQKLQAMSYTSSGQDREQLFTHIDRDNSGGLQLDEFVRAIRKVGQITAVQMSDEEIGALFTAVDSNNNGVIEVDELADFVFGSAEDGGDDEPVLQPPTKPEMRQLAAAVNKAKSDLEYAVASLEAAELPEMKETLRGVVAAHKTLYRELHSRWETASAAVAAAATTAAVAEVSPAKTPQLEHAQHIAGSRIPRLSPHSARKTRSSPILEPEPEPEAELQRGPEQVESPDLSLMAEQLHPDDLGFVQEPPDSSGEVAVGRRDAAKPVTDIAESLSGLWTVTGQCNGQPEAESFLLFAVADVVPGVFTLHGCSVDGNSSPGGTLEPFSLRGEADLRGLLADGAVGAPPAHASRVIFTQHYDEAGPEEQSTMWVATPTVHATREDSEDVEERPTLLTMAEGRWSGAVAGTFEAIRDRSLTGAETERLRTRVHDVYELAHCLSGLWTVTGQCNGQPEAESFLLFAEAEVVPGVFMLHGCSVDGNSSPGGTLEPFSLRGEADLRGLLADGAPTSRVIFTQHYDEAGPEEQPTEWVATPTVHATREDSEDVEERPTLLTMAEGRWSGAVAGTFEAIRDRSLTGAETERLRTGRRRR